MVPSSLVFSNTTKIMFFIFMIIYVVTFHPWILSKYFSDKTVDTPQQTIQYREAIFTVISSELYLPTLLVLGHTLQKYHSSQGRDLIVFIPHKGIKQPRHLEMIKEMGFTPIFVDTISFPGGTDWKFVDMLVKLYAWNYTQYDIIAFIDSDAMLMGDIELPFQLMRMTDFPLAACIAPTFPSPSSRDKLAGHFNAGVMFFRPNEKDFKELIFLSRNKSYYDLGLGEQSLLNEYYLGRWLGLPLIYNLIFKFRDRTDIWAANRNEAKIIHFAGDHKPWNRYTKEQLHADDIMWRETFRQLAFNQKWGKDDFVFSDYHNLPNVGEFNYYNITDLLTPLNTTTQKVNITLSEEKKS